MQKGNRMSAETHNGGAHTDGKKSRSTLSFVVPGPNGPQIVDAEDLPEGFKKFLDESGILEAASGGPQAMLESVLAMAERNVPLCERIESYGVAAGAEVARYNREPKAEHRLGMAKRLAATLARTRSEDSVRYENVRMRLAAHGYDLNTLVEILGSFVAYPTPDRGKELLSYLSWAIPLSRAAKIDFMEDLSKDRTDRRI